MGLSKIEWLAAREVRALLLSAGLATSELNNSVAWYCLRRGLIATGFGRVHDGGQTAQGLERSRVSHRLWRFLAAEERPQFACIVRWEDGEFTYIITRESGTDLQESWDSVHFDQLSVASTVREIEARTKANLLHVFEIEAWIRNRCQTENSKDAWKLFKDSFGARAGKKLAFVECWKEVKGPRKRGRMPKTAPSG